GATRLSASWTHPGPSAEDAGFEPARAVNPTRVPGERHRPLGESSAGYGSRPARCALRVARGTSPGRPPSPSGWVGPQLARGVPPPLHKPAGALVLHSLRTPRGVYPVNSPRAGRQQGSMGSGGCAGSPLSVDLTLVEGARCRFSPLALTNCRHSTSCRPATTPTCRPRV